MSGAVSSKTCVCVVSPSKTLSNSNVFGARSVMRVTSSSTGYRTQSPPASASTAEMGRTRQ